MVRCQKCGTNNRPGAKFCGRCGNPFPQPQPQAQPQTSQQPVQTPQASQPVQTPQTGFDRLKNLGTRFVAGVRKVADTAINRIFSPEPKLEGSVIEVFAPYDEPSEFNWSKLIWGILCILLLLPVLPIILFLGVIMMIVQSIAKINLWQMFGIPFLTLWGTLRAARKQTEPVQNFRVRDNAGQEHDVRMKGYLSTGSISNGDVLKLWGTWKKGSLHFEKAENLRTKASVLLKNRVEKLQRVIAALTLFYLILLLIGYLI